MGLLYRSSLRVGRITARGTSLARFNNYHNLQEFEELFREHFRDFLAGQVDREVGQKRYA